MWARYYFNKTIQTSTAQLHSCYHQIINLSLEKGDFSAQWKSAVVCPLIKSLPEGTTNNYRPVSNPPFISNVAEKSPFNSLATIVIHTTYCQNTNLLTDRTWVVKQVCLNLQMTHYGEWKRGHLCCHNPGPIGCLQYHWPQPIAWSSRQKVWYQGQSSSLIWTISETRKIQSMHKWHLLTRKNNGIQCPTRVHTRFLLLY